MSTTTPVPNRPSRQHPPAHDALMQAYLRRLGQPVVPPSTDALAALHRAHVERIPYETFWLHLHEGWGIGAGESLQRIVTEQRGGYCFHLNGAFAELLGWLGYSVTRHSAGVHDATGPDPATVGNHLALTVHGLPDDGNPAGRWWVDAGLGDALHEPLPLVPGEYAQGPTTFTIGAADGVGDWCLGNDAAGSFAGVSVTSPVVPVEHFTARHEFNATSPESGFARTVTAQRRHAAGVDVLRGCVLTTRGAATSTQTFEDRTEWLEALDDVFSIRLAVPDESVEELWSRVQEAHAAWLENESVTDAMEVPQ